MSTTAQPIMETRGPEEERQEPINGTKTEMTSRFKSTTPRTSTNDADESKERESAAAATEVHEDINVDNIQEEAAKKTLRKHFSNRPKREELVSRHILKAFNTDPGLQRVMTNLLRQRVKSLLNQNLSQRKSIQSLIRSNILQAPSDNAGNEMFRRMSDHDLTQFLAQRISLAELQRANVVEDVLTWINIPTTGTIPRPRNCHTANIMKNRENHDTMFILGGFGTGSASLELLRLNLFTFVWSRPLVGGVVPSERYSHTTCVVGNHLLVFGGFSVDGQWLNDLHALDTEHSSEFVPSLGAFGVNKSKTSPLLLWYQPECTGDPPEARAAHSACVVGTNMYIFGGNTGSRLYNDLHVLNLHSMEWTQPSTLGDAPCARAGHSMTLIHGTLIVIFGGSDGSKPLNDIHYFDTETCTWSTPKVVGTPPSPRAGHTAVAYGKNKILVFAGGFHTQIFNDLYMYDIDTCSWARPSDTGLVPSARAGHSCVISNDSNTLYIFAGGDVERELFNDFYTLDPGYIKTSEDAIASDMVLKKSRSDGDEDNKSVSATSDNTATSASFFDGDISQEFRKAHDEVSDMISAVTKNINEKVAHFRTREHQLFQILKAIESERNSLVADMRNELSELQINISAHFGKLEQRVYKYFLHTQISSVNGRNRSASTTGEKSVTPSGIFKATVSSTPPHSFQNTFGTNPIINQNVQVPLVFPPMEPNATGIPTPGYINMIPSMGQIAPQNFGPIGMMPPNPIFNAPTPPQPDPNIAMGGFGMPMPMMNPMNPVPQNPYYPGPMSGPRHGRSAPPNFSMPASSPASVGSSGSGRKRSRQRRRNRKKQGRMS